MGRPATLRGLLAAGRLFFLLGGVALYALGLAVAFYEGYWLSIPRLLLGLGAILSIQLMTHYNNEYWDQDADALVTLRTPFSGGSGAVAGGMIGPHDVRNASVACAVLAVLFTLGLLWAGASAVALLAIAVTALGALSYSQPPMRVVARGVGEIWAALVVAFLTPLVAYSVQTGGVSAVLVAACLPAIVMQALMIIAIELPDYEADVATGKGNLVVRLGRGRAARLHNVLLVGVYAVLLASVALGRPPLAGLLPLGMIPLAIVQARLVVAVALGEQAKTSSMTLLAILLLSGFCLLQIAGFVLPALARR